MSDTGYFDRLIALRDDMRAGLRERISDDGPADARARVRLGDLEHLIDEWGSPRS